MASTDVLKVGFIPFAAPGHMIPLMDIARIFARQGVEVTFFTTTANATRFQKDVDSDFNSGFNIRIHTLQLPYAEVGLPPGIESFSEITSMQMAGKLGRALSMLENQIEQLLCDMKADCIVSDMILGWTTDTAARLGIPRLVFHCAGYTALSIEHSIGCHEPQKNVESDYESFIVPGLPHKIEMTRSQLPNWENSAYGNIAVIKETILEARRKSHGIVMNSFYDLEADFIKYYENNSGMKSWAIGPVSLWVDKHVPTDGIGKSELIEWLDSQEENSVLYVSFGSMTKFPDTQLLELAHALENSGHRFIWVVRKRDRSCDEDGGGYLPDGFEERMRRGKKGLIIRNWAPQLLILNHPAIGGFVTQCGWNSVLESVCAGQPIISWPITAEQFEIEKLVAQVLKIAVPVGAKRWWDMQCPEELEIVNREQITKAISFLMSDGNEVDGMRKRVKELARAAKRATSSGGASHATLMSLIDELKSIKLASKK